MKFPKQLIGCILGLFSVLLIIEVMLILVFRNPNYRIFYHIVSLLGVWSGKEIFNLFIIITGILQIPFFESLRRNLKRVKEIKSGVRNSAYISGIIFCLAEVGVGVFPIGYTFILNHGMVAFLFFHSAIFTILLFSILLLHDSDKKAPAYVGFIVVLLITNFQFWRGGFFEWIAILSIYFWVAFTSIYFIMEINITQYKISKR